jgi:hypothetical protein
MNISLPGDLKAEMDAVKESVNWSNVAAEAFRRALLDLASSRKGKNMEDVIKRLKAAAVLEEDTYFEDGKTAGTQWAKDEARPSQLRRLEDSFSRSPGPFEGEPDAYGWAGVVYFLINGDRQADRHEINDFWERVLGEDDRDRIYEPRFAEGFAAGAVELWESVQSHL